MIKLHDKETGKFLGTVTEPQLRSMMDILVKEDPEDQDYYIDGPTLDLLESEGVDEGLLKILQDGLGSRPEMEVKWSRA